MATFACKNVVEKSSRGDKELIAHLQFGPLPRRKSEVLKKLKDWACKYNIMPQLSQYWVWSFKFRDTKLGILCLKVNRFKKVFYIFWHELEPTKICLSWKNKLFHKLKHRLFNFIPIPIICSNWHFDFWNKIPRTISFESVILCVKVSFHWSRL